MAKELDWQDYSATTEDADGDSHVSTVRAAVVDKDTAGEYNVRGTATQVNAGSVLIETDRPGVYDALDSDSWKGTGYGKSAPVAKKTTTAKKTAGKR